MQGSSIWRRKSKVAGPGYRRTHQNANRVHEKDVKSATPSTTAAGVYALLGILLVTGKKTRAAATWLGLTILFLELVVYVPIGIVERASVSNGLNYVADTLMFCGAGLLLATAMPRGDSLAETARHP